MSIFSPNFNLYQKAIAIGDLLESKRVGLDYLESPEKQILDKIGPYGLRAASYPVRLVAECAVRQQDGGPAVIEVPRIGKDLEYFGQRKIRSMSIGSERVNGHSFTKKEDDPRITKVGRYIRKLSIDELPQLDNVLRGEMSLVGPRPKTMLEAEYYASIDPKFISSYAAARPGLTGLEQISGRALLDPADRIELTHQYIQEASLALDMDILRKTCTAIINARGAF